MENKDLLLRQYELYTHVKENFVDRNFTTNKFYLVLILALFGVLFWAKGVVFAYSLSATIILSVIGMGVCFLWWSNVDTYDTLIKIKLSKVIDEIEKQMPVAPHTLERESLNKLREEKKAFLFSDMQKALACGIFIIFMVLFLFDMVPLVMAVIQ